VTYQNSSLAFIAIITSSFVCAAEPAKLAVVHTAGNGAGRKPRQEGGKVPAAGPMCSSGRGIALFTM
jgi:hypothetical protein